MWNLKYDAKELIYETGRLTDVENRLVGAKGEGGRREDREFGISRCRLLYRMDKQQKRSYYTAQGAIFSIL